MINVETHAAHCHMTSKTEKIKLKLATLPQLCLVSGILFDSVACRTQPVSSLTRLYVQPNFPAVGDGSVFISETNN